MTTTCDRCARRAPAIRALGAERAGIAPAVGTFTITKWSGKTEIAALCATDLKGMRSAGWTVEENR